MTIRPLKLDDTGTPRCSYCGGSQFTHKRTKRAIIALGVFAVAAPKHATCVVCGAQSSPCGERPQRYTGPSNPRYTHLADSPQPTGQRLTLGQIMQQQRREARARKRSS